MKRQLRDPEDILKEIAALDKQSVKIIAEIEKILIMEK
ncbi:MAG: hypothetical protein Ta2C_09450 [Candidatus Endomicrobiellum trichonymphae]|nr:MAG: hypothetical protein Ta2C_09450 [Candidatus Endomicrobium trichonymphae]